MLKNTISCWNTCAAGRCGAVAAALGLLVLRFFTGGLMALQHGWPKLANFSAAAGSFPDPLGVGSTASLALVIFAEFFCALLVLAGLLTRLAAIPLIINMAVAAFVIHGSDPLDKKELALMYLIPFVTIFLCGPGKISFDALILRIVARPVAVASDKSQAACCE